MFTRVRSAALVLALVGSALVAAPAAAAGPVYHSGNSGHKEVTRVYYDDDICGDRAGWTEYVTTWHWAYTERSEGVFNFMYIETGTYHADFDDPSIPSEDSQFTGAEHQTITGGGTHVWTVQWHDFPGTITIHEQFLFVQVGDDIRVDRYILRVDGCP